MSKKCSNSNIILKRAAIENDEKVPGRSPPKSERLYLSNEPRFRGQCRAKIKHDTGHFDRVTLNDRFPTV